MSSRTVLNLVNPKDIWSLKYEIIKFPDGQQNVKITSMLFPEITGVESVTIKSRLNNFRDLEIIICANQALKEIGFKSVDLYVPYFIGSRSDRKFETGSVNYLKKVISPIINAQGFNRVTVTDPHSDVLEACLENYTKISNYELVKFALTKIDNKNGACDRVCLVSPDSGAYKKVFDVAQNFQIENIITANKIRDLSTGKIIKTEIPELTKKDLNYIIVDDICDGGRTFNELSKAIKEKDQDAKIYLVVTHGIFSAGFDELNKNFEGIFTTNSYSDLEDLKGDTSKVTQMNIF